MKAVLDTNVIVSGIFFGGVPGSVLERWADGAFELVLSPAIFNEYVETCEHLGSSRPDLTYRSVLIRLIGDGTLVADIASGEAITRDPDDDKFMLCAYGIGADVVSGDHHLLDASGWRGVEVRTPRRFLELIDR